MDGSHRTDFISKDVHWPNGITLDYPRKKVYWADAHFDYIGSANYDGSQIHRLVAWPHLAHPFALTMFGNNLYWSDWIRDGVVKVDKFSGNRSTLVNSFVQPMDLHVYHSSRQPVVWGPCMNNTCGCGQLCLITANQTCTCACGNGYKLDSNKKSCSLVKSFLLFARRTEIRGIPLDPSVKNDAITPILGLGNAVGLDFDERERKIYLSDVTRDNISRIDFSGKNLEVLVKDKIKNVDGIAIDWLGRNMYWTDAGTREIAVAKLNGSFRRTIFKARLGIPRAIALHPTNG